MKRSLYADGVEVTREDLERTEDTKIAEVKARKSVDTRVVRDGVFTGIGGVVSGLRVTRNGTNTSRFDVSSGEAYVPSGERVELTAAQSNIALADYTDGARNLIGLVYTESETTTAPHETDGSSRNTQAIAAFRLQAFSEAEYDDLQDSNDDLALDAKDRIAIIAVILGDGSGNPINTSEIFQETLPSDHVTATYATAQQPLSGVNVLSHGLLSPPTSFDTSEVAQIRLEVVSSSVKNASYKQAGSATFGTAVNIATLNTTTTLTGNEGAQLTIDVVADMLVSVAGTYTRNLDVSRTYDPDGPLYASSDLVHRHLSGGGPKADNNPHGMSLDDLAQAILRVGRRMFVSSQATSAAESELPISIWSEVSSSLGAGVKTLMWQWSPNDSTYGKVRFYLNAANKSIEVTVNAKWDPTSAAYRTDTTTAGRPAYRLTLFEQAAAGAFFKVESVPVPGTSFTSWGETLLSTNLGSGSLLTLFDAFLGTTDNDRSRLEMLATDTGTRTLLTTFKVKGGSFDSGEVRLYKNRTSGTYGGTGTTLELTYNCKYNHGTALWGGVSSTQVPAWKLELSSDNGVTLWAKQNVNSGITWADTISAGTWVQAWSFDTSGNLNTSGDVTADNYNFNTPVIGYYSVDAAYAQLSGTLATWVDSAINIPLSGTRSSPTKELYVNLDSNAPTTASAAMLPLHLPHGATITSAWVLVENSIAAGSAVRATVALRAIGSGSGSHGTTRTAAPNYDNLTHTSGAIQLQQLTTDRNLVVDNFNFTYYIWVAAVPDSGGPEAFCNFHGAYVQYTLSSVV